MVMLLFGGPSLRGVDLDPGEFTVLPPAAQGHLLAEARRRRPDAVGLLDCEMPYRGLPTWHKEILEVLSLGIPVAGAAAVGAHRAAELAPQGMEGVGSIFRRVASGELERDDEVLGDWEPAPEGYRILSLPLVTLRDALHAAQDRGLLSEGTARALVAGAEGLFWRRRTWETLLEEARRAGLPRGELEALQDWLPQAPDPVREDARALVDRLRELRSAPAKRQPEPRGRRGASPLFKSLDYRDRPVPSRSGPVRQWCIGDHASFAHPEAEDLNGHALNRRLALLLADLWGLTPTEVQVQGEETRLRRRFRLKTDEDLHRWREENDLDPEQYRKLLEEQALLHHLHRWIMQGRIHGKNTEAILDELRLRGDYGEWKERAGARETLLRENEEACRREYDTVDARPFLHLIRDHLRAEGFPWHGTMLLDALPETGLEAGDLLDEILQARAVRGLRIQALGGDPRTPESPGPKGPETP